jgi:hypothetical protein
MKRRQYGKIDFPNFVCVLWRFGEIKLKRGMKFPVETSYINQGEKSKLKACFGWVVSVKGLVDLEFL